MMHVWHTVWGKIENKLMEKHHLVWINAFLKSSGISLVLISLIWIGLEVALTGTRTENGIDTVIAFIAAFGIGYFYAQNNVKKEENKELIQAIQRQNRVIAEQTDTLEKIWKMKKQGQ